MKSKFKITVYQPAKIKKKHQKPKEKAKRCKTARSNNKTCKKKLRSIEASTENRASIW